MAAHALLACICGYPEAIDSAEKAVKSRCGQATAFLADTPKSIDRFTHDRLLSVWETISPTKEGEENHRDDELYFGAIMDMIVRGIKPSVLNNFLWLKHDLSQEDEEIPIFVSVSTMGTYSEVGDRACTYAPLEAGGAEIALKNAVWRAAAWLKINALGSMLGCLGNGREHVLQTKSWVILCLTNRATPSLLSRLTAIRSIGSFPAVLTMPCLVLMRKIRPTWM